MIKYALSCDHDHGFEGWFGSSSDYDDQAARGLVGCPLCGSTAVRKQIMSPSVVGTRAQKVAPEPSAQMREMMKTALGEMRRQVEESFDYVGDRFAKEARDIHDGKSEDRGIYGEASPTEVKALVEDGIRIAPLPPAAPKKSEVN
jgi:hypothetical protein